MPWVHHCYTKRIGPSDLLVYAVEFPSQNYRKSIAQLYNLASRADTLTRLLEMLPSPNQTYLSSNFQPFLGGLPGKGLAGMAIFRRAIFVSPFVSLELVHARKTLGTWEPQRCFTHGWQQQMAVGAPSSWLLTSLDELLGCWTSIRSSIHVFGWLIVTQLATIADPHPRCALRSSN